MTLHLVPSKSVSFPRQIAALSALAFSLALLAGCGSNSSTTSTPPPPPPYVEPNNCKSTHTTSPAQPAPTANLTGPALSGVVRAGNLPIAGATVTLYAAGTTGNGSAPISLLTTPLTTDGNGSFTVPAGFVCPLSNSLLYAVATGGMTGTGGTANTAISFATVLGPCGSISSGSTFTLDEATTVATAYSMAQFLSGENIGATATNSSGLLLAAATAANLVDPTTGIAPGAGFPSTGTAPSARINSLASLLNACVVSSAGSTACSNLFSTSSPTATDTFSAAINIAKHPGTNIATLYTLSRASAAYQPALTTAPADWTLPINYTGGGMSGPSAVAIDSTGKVWVANYYSVASLFSNTGTPVFPHGITGGELYESYGAAVDVNDTFWVANEENTYGQNNGLGTVTVLNNTGGVNALLDSGGINFPIAVAFDTSGVSWVVDYGNSSITLLDATGAPLSGTAGYSSADLAFPVAVATDAKCNAYVANQPSNTITRVLADGSGFTDFTVGDGPSGLAIDASGNIWTANYYGDSVGLVSSSGTVLSGTGYTGGGLSHPQGIAVDGSGTAWVVNYRGPALSELAAASASTPGAILSPASGWAPDAKLSEAFGLAIDASGNLWATNFATNTLTEFVGLATPVQTPQLGPVRIP
jgi:streptogramin lyase